MWGSASPPPGSGMLRGPSQACRMTLGAPRPPRSLLRVGATVTGLIASALPGHIRMRLGCAPRASTTSLQNPRRCAVRAAPMRHRGAHSRSTPRPNAHTALCARQPPPAHVRYRTRDTHDAALGTSPGHWTRLFCAAHLVMDTKRNHLQVPKRHGTQPHSRGRRCTSRSPCGAGGDCVDGVRGGADDGVRKLPPLCDGRPPRGASESTSKPIARHAVHMAEVARTGRREPRSAAKNPSAASEITKSDTYSSRRRCAFFCNGQVTFAWQVAEETNSERVFMQFANPKVSVGPHSPDSI